MAEMFPVKPKLRPSSSKITPTPESKYWRSFKIPKYIETTPSKSFTFPINSIIFSPIDPHDFAATHSANVSIFSGKTLEPKPKISAFSDTAASASFRCDGKLLAVGYLTGTVHVFDAKSRSHLRRLKVVELRADDVRCSDKLRNHVRNIKRDVEEEMRIQQSLLEIQGIISPMLRIAARE